MCDIMNIKTGVNNDNIIKIGKEVIQLLGVNNKSYIARSGQNKDLVVE
jgi:hypothetical protein